MARKSCRAQVSTEHMLTCVRTHCGISDHPIPVAYRTQRTIPTLQGNCRLILRVRRCRNAACAWYHRSFRPRCGGEMGLTPRRVRSGCDCSGWHPALYRSTFAFLKSIKGFMIEGCRSPNGLSLTCFSATRNWWHSIWGKRLVYENGSKSRDRSSWRSTGYNQMWATRSCGCCATAVRGKSWWHAVC